MKRQLPPLNALRAFEVAARVGSFTGAAEELSVSQGAISRHIQHLEAVLGVTLFTRSHRLVSLTGYGRDYAEAIGAALGAVEMATARLKESASQDPVRFRGFSNFVQQWLLPRLGSFTEANPDIQVIITTADEGPLTDGDLVDLTVHVHQPRQFGLEYHELFDHALIPVCRPELATQLGEATEASHLARGRLIHSARRPDDWKQWFEKAGAPEPAAYSSIFFENSALVYRGALSGLGIALVQKQHVRTDIEEGRLVCPWWMELNLGRPFELVCRKGAPRNVQRFMRWLIKSARNDSDPARFDPRQRHAEVA